MEIFRPVQQKSHSAAAKWLDLLLFQDQGLSRARPGVDADTGGRTSFDALTRLNAEGGTLCRGTSPTAGFPLCLLCVLVFELLNAACRVYEQFLTGEEGV